MKNKKAQMPVFGWIFAIIIGAVILFLAIYGTVRFLGTEHTAQDTELVNLIDVLLNPYTSIEDVNSISGTISISKDSYIELECDSHGDFGKNTLTLKSKSELKGARETKGYSNYIYNKYIYSKKEIEGKEIEIIIKPFKIPFEVDKLIIIIPEKYCFYKTPVILKKEISEEQLSKIFFAEKIGDCQRELGQDFKLVCFEGRECPSKWNIKVTDKSYGDYDYGAVEKKKENNQVETLNYVNYESKGMLFAAIFSDEDIYECNFKRLMKRLKSVLEIYEKKNSVDSQFGGCYPFTDGLRSLKNIADEIASSTGLTESNARELHEAASSLESQNDYSDCKLY